MKWIKYETQVESTIERGVAEDGTPITETVTCSTMRTVPYNAENEAIAKEQAYNGEYEIFDDGLPEPVKPETDGPTFDDMAEAIKEGVNEV